ncbi:MAG: hypothetical protein HYR85_16630 [Planctomycetes bacterium]|nr:hypothetical protein [Planctomycetota bacterium]MBI3843678.1 hypothetical protein [Planctomycetota bacterium]
MKEKESKETALDRRKRQWAEKAWDKARGIESIDYNNGLELIKASVEEVSLALAPLTFQWLCEALGRDVIWQPSGTFVFRLAGHKWTELLEPSTYPRLRPDERLGQSLSRVLSTEVLTYSVSDTCGSIGYQLWNCGESLESFYAEDDGESRPRAATAEFASKLRPAAIEGIQDIWHHVHDVFLRLDACEPGFAIDYFLGHELPKPGAQAKVRNPGVTMNFSGDLVMSTPEFERVDYVVLRASPAPSESG